MRRINPKDIWCTRVATRLTLLEFLDTKFIRIDLQLTKEDGKLITNYQIEWFYFLKAVFHVKIDNYNF